MYAFAVTEWTEPQSRRDRPAKALLSRNVIVDAALELVAQQGLDAVTLRKVADRLDTGPASLYVYVDNRDELLERMLDRVLSEVPEIPIKHKRWRRRLVDLFTEMLEALDHYPGIAQPALGSAQSRPAAAAIGDNALGLLRVGGVDEQSAVWARDALMLLTIATAVQRAAEWRPPSGPQAQIGSAESDLGSTAERVAPGSGPRSSSSAEPDVGADELEQFTFALNAIIRGARDSQPSG
jgi:AcrR family transcriptional regulator